MAFLMTFTEGFLVAFGVPLIFLLCSAMGRKLVRGTPWERRDFYLGVELTLATFSADVLYLIELLRAGNADKNGRALLAAAIFTAVNFGAYIWLLTLHQDWEQQINDRRGQILRLVIASNLLGTLLFAAFVFMVKGVR